MMDADGFRAIVAPLGRTLAQRTTLYGRVSPEGGGALPVAVSH